MKRNFDNYHENTELEKTRKCKRFFRNFMLSWFVLMFFLSVSAAQAELTVKISPNPAVVEPKGEITFNAEVLDSSGQHVTAVLHWKVMPASLGTIDEAGHFVAGEREGRGIVRVIARFEKEVGVGHSLVRVSSSLPKRLLVQIDPQRVNLKPGGEQEFKAAVSNPEGMPVEATISWRVIPEDFGQINESGLFTAGLRRGTARIIAYAKSEEGEGLGTAVAKIEQEREKQLIVRIGPKRVSVKPGESQQFEAQVEDAEGNPVNAKLVWNVMPVKLGTITQDGLFTASPEGGVGLVRVSAEWENAFGIDRAFVNVSELRPKFLVKIRPKKVILAPNKTQEFKVEVFDQNGNIIPVPRIIWKVIPPQLGQITPEGIFTAGEKAGHGRIIAELPSEIGKGRDASFVIIKPPGKFLIKIYPERVTVKPGGTIQFTAQVFNPEGEELPNPPLIWKVYPSDLGTITPDGFFTAGPTPKLGAVIALLSKEIGFGRKMAPVLISNYVVRIQGERPFKIREGQTHQFTALVYDAEGNLINAPLIWEVHSQTPGFGTITPDGFFTAGTVPPGEQNWMAGRVIVRLPPKEFGIGGDEIGVIVWRP
ncbi:MAG: hypothetical protein AB1393_10760 [Candidatus Edwardsbacteria bacterium]